MVSYVILIYFDITYKLRLINVSLSVSFMVMIESATATTPLLIDVSLNTSYPSIIDVPVTVSFNLSIKFIIISRLLLTDVSLEASFIMKI